MIKDGKFYSFKKNEGHGYEDNLKNVLKQHFNTALIPQTNQATKK